MTEKDEYERIICAECGNPIPKGQEVDHGHRTPWGEEVEAWVCRSCDEEITEDALGQLP